MSSFVPKKEYLLGILLHYFIKKKCTVEATECLLRLTTTILYREQQAEIGLDAPKIMILISKVKNTLAHRKV